MKRCLQGERLKDGIGVPFCFDAKNEEFENKPWKETPA
jgi:hypothetical protein